MITGSEISIEDQIKCLRTLAQNEWAANAAWEKEHPEVKKHKAERKAAKTYDAAAVKKKLDQALAKVAYDGSDMAEALRLACTIIAEKEKNYTQITKFAASAPAAAKGCCGGSAKDEKKKEAPKDEKKKEAPKYVEGHYHYKGCPNDTLENYKKTDCDCAAKNSSHAQKLARMSAASGKGGAPAADAADAAPAEDDKAAKAAKKAADKAAKKAAKQAKKDTSQGNKWGKEVSRQAEISNLKCTIIPNTDLGDSWQAMKNTIKVCNDKLTPQGLSCVALSASGLATHVIVGVSTSDGLDAMEFLDAILKMGPEDTKRADDNTKTMATAFIACNPDKEQFGLKIKDAYQQGAFMHMKKLGLVPEDSSSEEDDDDDVPFNLNDM